MRWNTRRWNPGTTDRSASISLSFETLEARQMLAFSVFTDSLADPFQDWSYGTTVDFSNSDPVRNGSSSIAVTHNEAWAGMYLGSPVDIAFDSGDEISFSVHGGTGGSQLKFYYVDTSFNWVPFADVTPSANQWSDIVLDFEPFGTPSLIRGFVFQEFTGSAQTTFYLDDFVVDDFLPEDPGETQQGPAITIDSSLELRAINDDIYGLNFADNAFAAEIDLPVNRWGGNATSQYNWRTDSTNLGSDWFFENYPSDTVDPLTLPLGSTADYFVGDNQAIGAESIITVGTTGWKSGSRDVIGAFQVDKYGAQQSTDPYNSNFGNGVRPDGSLITGNDPFDVSIQVIAKETHRWVDHLTSQYGTAAEGGVRFYALDNEPMLWNSTHRAVHPDPASYNEVLENGALHANAILQADPTAEVLGPVSWGWTGYFYSALDAAAGGDWWNNPQDRNAHGGDAFLPWYLDQMRQYGDKLNRRLLHYLDVHYYPQNPGVALTGVGDAATQQQRLESTRSLWDPNYVDETWINEEVNLIPRMRSWIDQNYPGTKLAITEYNFGGTEHINGAVTQADVLGIFGREGVDLATMWSPPEPTDPAAYAFRMFRNYDGTGDDGGKFGDISLQAISGDSDQVSVFAARRNLDDAVTVILINKSTEALQTPIDVSAEYGDVDAEFYQYDSSNLTQIVQSSDLIINEGLATITLPGYSITLLELPASGNSFAKGSLHRSIQPGLPIDVSPNSIGLDVQLREAWFASNSVEQSGLFSAMRYVESASEMEMAPQFDQPVGSDSAFLIDSGFQVDYLNRSAGNDQFIDRLAESKPGPQSLSGIVEKVTFGSLDSAAAELAIDWIW